MPSYIYDLNGLGKHTKEVTRKLREAGFKTKYALKANPLPQIIRTLSENGVEGWDTSSVGELEKVSQALHSTVSGPGKTDDLLERAIELGTVIEVESISEIQRLRSLLRGRKRSYVIRVQYDRKVEGASVDLSSKWFGVAFEDVQDVVREAGPNLKLVGFHCFPGSQNLSTKGLCDYFEDVMGMLSSFAEEYELKTPYLNVGGGLGVVYHEGQKPLHFDSIVEVLAKNVKLYPEARWWIELGRYLVADYGTYRVKILDVKTVGDKVYLITDGGMHHFSSPSGNLGQVIPRNFRLEGHPVSNGSYEKRVVTVVGNLCTSIDVLARDIKLPILSIGDEISIKTAGAYGLSASPINFLGHPLPDQEFI